MSRYNHPPYSVIEARKSLQGFVSRLYLMRQGTDIKSYSNYTIAINLIKRGIDYLKAEEKEEKE